MSLVIETPSFKDGNKWRLWDGSNSIMVTIEDDAFLKAIDSGEPFRKGDILHCQVRTTQTRSGGSIHTKRAVVHVDRHEQRPGESGALFGVDGS